MALNTFKYNCLTPLNFKEPCVSQHIPCF